MSSSVVDFQAQIASIMEVLANAAVAEICKVVDDGYAVVQLEMSQSHKENDFLRRKIKLMELQLARLRAERTKSSEGSVHNRFHGIRLFNRHNREATTTGPTWQSRARLSSRSFGNNSIQRDIQPIDVDQEDVSSKHMEPSRDEQSTDTAEEEPDLLIIKVEGEADDQNSRTSHPARTVEDSRELNTQQAAGTTADTSIQPGGPRDNNCNTAMEVKFTTENERDLLPWKKKEGLGEMPGNGPNSGQRMIAPNTQISADSDQADFTEQLRSKYRLDTVYKSNPEPESGMPQHTGPGTVADQQCNLHPESIADFPGTSRKRKCSETETERPSCSSYAAKTVTEGPLTLTKLIPEPPVAQMVRSEQESSQDGSEVKSEFIVIDPCPVDEEDGGGGESSSWRSGDIIEQRRPQGGHSEADSLLLEGHSSNTYLHHPHSRVQLAARQNSPDNLFYGIDINGSFDSQLDAFQNPTASTAATFAAGTGEQQYPAWADFEGGSAHLGDTTGTHQDRGAGAEGARTYRCTFCGKEYPHLCQLKMHQRVHTGEKPYECAQCGKQFSQLCSLKRHQRVHTGEKPFRCAQCGKQFSHSSNLKVHQSVHTGEKRFHCAQCGKNFSFLSNLIRHQAVHAGKR
ncbi:zinc finger protein 768-like [Esox lucius]|uniref:zinc finger protein 768-like n=1 Tax=Esox lucius TaxID=8010 RepID=UPI000576A063|nr:zinc finger protein 768-like [Esox lucius]